jgi:ribosome biogenesis GTPase / thiamine phosphate phosphatase
MSKRKLNRRQLWRIEKIQTEKQARQLKTESLIKNLSGETEHLNQLGIVSARFGKQLEVQVINEQGQVDNTQSYLCHIRANIPDMVVGDEVYWHPLDEHTGVVEALCERQSFLARRDKHGQQKMIAANITQVFIVIAAEPETPPLVIDRYLVACELLKLNVSLLINKSDLASSTALLDALQKNYLPVVDDVFLCSIHNAQQLSALQRRLANHNSVFIGQSGVGKSSLVQSLIGDENIKTGALSQRSGLGQHTTSTSRLYHLADGGCIIDSPGIRDFDLDEVSIEELQQGFKEFQSVNEPCKFRNCLHHKEPKCAIQNAVAAGLISEQRYQNYLALAQQLNLLK